MSAALKRTTLAGKISLLTITLVLVTSTIIGTTVVIDQRKKIYREMVDDGVTLAQLVAQNSHYGIYTEDEASLRNLLATLRVDPDIEYAAVFDSDRKVLGHVRFGAETGTPAISTWAMTQAGGGLFVSDGGAVVEIVVPVLEAEESPLFDPFFDAATATVEAPPLGYTLLGLSTYAITSRVRALMWMTALSTLAVILVGIVATVYLTRRIVGPLSRLHEAVEGIADDAPVEPVAVSSSDEIGGLTGAFNRMLASLRTYRREVAERTEALRRAHDDLERQNRKLKELDRMKNTFIDAVSHELKTPVAKHAMQIEILKPALASHSLEDREHRALLVMEESIHRQQETIRNLLDLSRLKDGRIRYAIEEIELDLLLDNVLRDYRYATSAHGFTVETETSGLRVAGDRKMLWHVFSNIINNAIKFRPHDEPPRLAISAADSGGMATVHFDDNGIGLSKQELSEAFSTFFQASASIEGSGVGLSICKMIVEGLGGKIWMESPGKGRGTTTSVSLPLHPRTPPPPPGEADVVSSPPRPADAP